MPRHWLAVLQKLFGIHRGGGRQQRRMQQRSQIRIQQYCTILWDYVGIRTRINEPSPESAYRLLLDLSSPKVGRGLISSNVGCGQTTILGETKGRPRNQRTRQRSHSKGIWLKISESYVKGCIRERLPPFKARDQYPDLSPFQPRTWKSSISLSKRKRRVILTISQTRAF